MSVFVHPLWQVWTNSHGREWSSGLSYEMKDGNGCSAHGRSRPLCHTHIHSYSLSLTPTCTPGLSFDAEMGPAWAYLHNTLLTPLLSSSITPRQLLQVWAFVWACLLSVARAKARHKRLISQLFFPSFFPSFSSFLLPPSLYLTPILLFSFLVHPLLSFHKACRMTAAR